MSIELPTFLTLASPGHYVLTMSASAAETMMLCPAKYSWSRVTGIEAVTARAGMNYGKALHLLFKALYAGESFDAATILNTYFTANPQPETNAKGKPEWRTAQRALQAFEAYREHYGAEDFEVLGVEEPFEVLLGDFEAQTAAEGNDSQLVHVRVNIRGIRDLRVRWHDQVWVLDHKTSTEWSDLAVDEGRASFQFMEYAWVERLLKNVKTSYNDEGEPTDMPCPKGGYHLWRCDGVHTNRFCGKCFIPLERMFELAQTLVGGVIGNYIVSRQPYSEGRKATARDLPRDYFHREPYPYSAEQLEEWHEDAMDLAKEIFTRWSTQNWKRNRTACSHWGRCEYYRLCWETDPAYREAAALSADYRARTPSPFEELESAKASE